MQIFILRWSQDCERWGGYIHTEGYFSSRGVAEIKASTMKLDLSDATPWTKEGKEWRATRHGTEYVMWIDEELLVE